MSVAIEVRGLTKTYRTYRKQPGFRGAIRGLFHREHEEVHAARDIQFTVEEGETVGFLGPNGAGKTTTLKMLAGLLYPTSGTAKVLGHVPWERSMEYRRSFALVMGQKNQLWWDLPARESLELNSRIYNLDPSSARRTIETLTERLQVQGKLDTMVRELSLGERMKMELVAALLHQPKVLFLDEPTIGLDVVSQQTVRDFLREYNAETRATILLTSHYMHDIQAICRRVIIVDRGRVFFDGALREIVDRFADHKQITLRANLNFETEREALSAFGEVAVAEQGNANLRVPKASIVTACKGLLERYPVEDLDIQDVPIEDIIRRLFDTASADSPAE